MSKRVPSLPDESASWTKDQLGEYVVESILINLGPAASSDLLPRQLESCVGGISAAQQILERAAADEHAQRYQQILLDYRNDAQERVEDCLQVFFVACQIYVTRVVEALRWVREHAGASFVFPGGAGQPHELRALGEPKVANQAMSVAAAMWHLGNYAKHHAELKEFDVHTRGGLIALGVIGPDGGVVEEPEVRGVEAVSGATIESLVDLENGVRTIAQALRAWAEHLVREIVLPCIDGQRCGDPLRSKREAERDRALWASILRRADQKGSDDV